MHKLKKDPFPSQAMDLQDRETAKTEKKIPRTHQRVRAGGGTLSSREPGRDTAYEMASIMSTPISTQQWAWSARASGSPDTQ